MNRQKTAGLMLLLVLASGLLGAQSSPVGNRPAPPTRRVLILNELDPYSVAISQIDEGIRDTLRGSKTPIEIYPEYMDTSLFPDKADQRLIRDFYINKYRNHRPDLIITVGSAPLQFMEEEHSKEFSGIPVVFSLSSGAEKNVKSDPDYTGVLPGIHAATTLKAALQMLPRTRNVYVISGAGPFDQLQVQDVKEQLESYSRRVDITYLAGLPMPELLKQVSGLPKDSVIIFSSLIMDGAGKFYTSRETGPLINSAANAPVFSLLDVQIGYGQVGGAFVKTRAQGEMAGREALQILDGTSPSKIPVMKAPNSLTFDWRALQRWGIKESDLPPGSTVLNRPSTPWELYKRYILGGLSLIALEALLIFGLLINRARARKAEAKLLTTSDRLRLALEEVQKEKAFNEAVIDSFPDIFFVLKPTGQFVHWGRNPERILGYTSEETLAMSQAIEIIAEADRLQAARAIGEGFSQGSVKVELQLLHRDGRHIPYLIRAARAQIGNESLLVGVGMDISERKQSEAELGRLNRALQTILECRRRMAEAQEEQAMLTEVCQVLVDLGGYRLVWVAFAENDEQKSVRPVAHAGHNEGYVESLGLTWADSERGRGPAGTAIRTGQPSVAWNISNDPRMAPWREAAMRHGIVSTISLPLLRDGRAFGALTLHSLEEEPFDDAEMSLLTDLANDVAYGIQALRTRADREKTAQELHESEARLRTIFEESGIGILVLDLSGHLLQANPAFQDMIGYSEGELRNMTFADITHPDQRKDNWQTLEGLVEGRLQSRYEMEKMYVRKDGQTLCARLTTSVVKDIQGQPQYIVTMVQDITEKRRSAEALRESEAQLREAEHIAGIGSSVWDVDTNTTTWSPELYRIMRLDPSQAPPNREGRAKIYTPESWIRLSAAIDQALTARKPYDMDIEFVRADGAVRWGHVRGTPVCDDAGRVTRLSGTLQDITERKLAQDSLLRLRQAVVASGEVVFMTDPERRITFINPQFTRTYGYTEEEVIGKQPREILKADNRNEAEYAELVRQIETKQSVNYEIVNKTKDGHELTMECSATVVLDEHGHLVGRMSVQRDVTARKQLEQQFLQAQKMEAVGQLAGGVAHDFNNLLGVITGYAELILDDHSLTDRARQRAHEINEAARRAAEVTRQLLALSRKQVLQKRAVDLNAVVHDTMKMLRRLVGEQIEFSIRLAPDLSSVEADPTSMDQVLMNLVINARDAMPDGGTLTIETTNITGGEARHDDLPPGNYVALAVSDTGIGMTPETRKRIFEPFFTTKQVGSGTGLGLSTVYGIVKQSGGYLRVDSELGHGAKFTIYLPRVAAATAPAQRPGAQTVPRGSETILLVEDDQKLRHLTGEMLHGLGYNVITGGNAAEAIEVAQAHSGPLHLLMTDIIMPGMNGHKLAELLSESRPDLRVLLVSGYTEATVAKQIADSGAMFLQKPFARKTLAAKIREALDTPARVKMN